jgi:NitT/TauT family transport system substrate-binding protein
LALGAGSALLRPAFAADSAAPIAIGYSTVTQLMMSGYYNSIPMTLYWPGEHVDYRAYPMAGANPAAEALATGRVDVAMLTNSALFALLDKFPDSDVVAIYTFTTGFNAMPAVRADSPLREIKDLQGKKVGLLSLGNSQLQVTKALMSLAGGDPNSMQFIAVGEGPEAAYALKSERVDALAIFDSFYAAVESLGVPLRELEGGKIDLDSIGFISSAVTTRRYMAEHRDALVRVFRGMAKATVFAQTNPEAAVRIHWKVYPETRMRGISEDEALRRSVLQVRARQKNVREVDGLIGNSSIRQISAYEELLLTGGIIRHTVDPDRIWDPSLLRDINDFDRDAVRKQAASWVG